MNRTPHQQALQRNLANAISRLASSKDLSESAEEMARLLRAGGLGFTALSVHLLDRREGTGRLYVLWPGPARWTGQDAAADVPSLRAHLEQRPRLWQVASGTPTWRLAVPTTQGAVEVADRRTDSYGLDEQEAWASLAPLLQLLVVRHRDLERLESPSRSGTQGEPRSVAPIGLSPRNPAGGFGQIVAASQAMRRVVELARLSATTDYPILILGESGTGKDLLARAIHAHSRRVDGPMVVVNSARLSTGVEDSELFGHARGAFTGATHETSGLVAAAHRGTLFLDEIGELALTSQAKVLRCLETGDVRRVGDTHSHTVDIRLIAATNRDLRQAVAAGTFRGDLYYRLAIITIDIPPLRDRPDDIPPLADRMLAQIRAQTQSRADLLPAALDVLVRYAWPGNARQLDSCLRYAALLAGHGAIGLEHLPTELRQPVAVGPTPTALTLAEVEKQHILRVMGECDQDRGRAQRVLGISRATLQRRLAEFGDRS
jgi:transcriptional regulator with PAS, ATPase and Fis domain